ncbi:MAG: DUF3794 domain-containing protein [Clostridia bacterium]|nr:DUF3794 domain-containing protein [Clostridia bacterium]
MDFNRENVSYDLIKEHKIGLNVSAKEMLEAGSKLLSVNAYANCGRCEVLNGEILFEGLVHFCAVCKNQEGQIKKIEKTERFSQSERISGATPKSKMLVSTSVERVRGYVESGNLLLSCTANVSGILITPMEKEILTDLSGDDVRKKEKSISADKVSFAQSIRFNVNQETELSPRVPEAEQILCICSDVSVREAHLSAGQLIVGGEITYQTVYASKDEFEPIVQVTDKCQFSSVQEMPEAQGTDVIVHLEVEEVHGEISNSDIGEARIISYAVSLAGYAYATEKVEWNVLSDAYSVKNVLETEYEPLNVTCLGENIKTTVNKNIAVPLPEGKIPISRISSATFTPHVIKCESVSNKTRLDCSGEVSVIYTASGTGETEGFNTTVAFELWCDNVDASKVLALLSINEMQATLRTGNEIELRLGFDIQALSVEEKECLIMQKAEESATEQMPEFGIIIYNTHKNEQVWDICKKFGVDEDELRKINPDITDEIQAGTRLYVFRKLRV